MKGLTLDGRLSSVGKFVRQGAVFADIGTDHGYLPLALLKNKIISRAILADINEGPLSSAMENAKEAGLLEHCSFHLSDGARELSGLGITDVAIAGMGGELIVDIMRDAFHLHTENVRFILQPMSHSHDLRRYLTGAGFKILAEDYSLSSGKYYVTIVAELSGTAREITDEEAYFGEAKFLKNLTPQSRGYLTARLSALKKTRDGKRLGGEVCSLEDSLISYIQNFLDDNGGAK
jgi:tRNA (adenine22-N1)-methyltransferase